MAAQGKQTENHATVAVISTDVRTTVKETTFDGEEEAVSAAKVVSSVNEVKVLAEPCQNFTVISI